MSIFVFSIMLIFVRAAQVEFDNSPKISLVFPKADIFEIVSDNQIIEFGFQVKNSSKLKNCSLILNSSKGENVITKSEFVADMNIISIELGIDEYGWKIICIDEKENFGSSEEKVLVLKKKQEKKETIRFFVAVTVVLLILIVAIAVLRSKSFKNYIEERHKMALKESLKKKLMKLEERRNRRQVYF